MHFVADCFINAHRSPPSLVDSGSAVAEPTADAEEDRHSSGPSVPNGKWSAARKTTLPGWDGARLDARARSHCREGKFQNGVRLGTSTGGRSLPLAVRDREMGSMGELKPTLQACFAFGIARTR
jgi:hypothetical protein